MRGVLTAMLSLSVLLAVAPRVRAAAKAVDGVVNLNTAPPEALALLPGIGPAKVMSIIAYRRRRPFRTVDELVRIKGIGRRMVRALRPHLAVAGPTTAAAARPAPPGAAALPASPPVPPRPPLACAARPGVPRPAARSDDRRLLNPVPLAARSYCLRPP